MGLLQNIIDNKIYAVVFLVGVVMVVLAIYLSTIKKKVIEDGVEKERLTYPGWRMLCMIFGCVMSVIGGMYLYSSWR